MNRLLLVVNAVLALFLLVHAWQTASVAAAGSKPVDPVVVDASALRIEPQFDGEGLAKALVVQLGRDLGPAQSDGEPVDLGVRLDPEQPVLTTWRNAHSVVVAPARPLGRARSFRVVFGRDLVGADGARLAAGAVVPFTTPPVQLLQVVPGGEGGPAARLDCVFDLPVAKAAAQKFLQVRTHAGEPVPCTVHLPEGEAAATRVALQPRDAERLPDALEVVVLPGLVPVGGDVPVGRPIVQAVRLRQPLRVLEASAHDGRIEIALNRAIDGGMAELVQVAPAVPFQLLPTERGVRLVGEFAPGTVVEVTLAAGFPGQGDVRLLAAERRTLLLPDRDPSLEFVQGGSVLCASALPKLAVQGCNVERPRLRLLRVYPNNLVRALQNGDGPSLAPARTLPIEVVAATNERWTESVDLQALAGGSLRGLYRVELFHQDRPWQVQRRWLQVTDLGLTWRGGRSGGVVQVTDLVRGAPVAGAQVWVTTPTNQELAAGTTGADGLLSLQWAHDADDRTPFVVVAQRGEDVAFVDLKAGQVELADEGLGGRAYAEERGEAFVWPVRGIVRPGETLDAAVLVRDARGLPRPAATLSARFRGPTGRVLRELSLPANGTGLHQVSWPLPLDAPTGDASLEVVDRDGDELTVLGSAAFRIEAFVPDRLEVEVVAVAPLRFAELGRVQVRGRWLDGAPAAGRSVTARVRLLAHAAMFASAPEFVFASGLDAPPPGELPAVKGTLDAEGRAELVFALPQGGVQQSLLAHVAIELEDPSGRVVRAAQSAPVLRSDWHLGVRAVAERCELRLCDAAGAPIAGERSATVRLEQRDWRWRYRQVGGGRWRWSTERIATALGEWHTTVRDGAGELALPPAGDDCFVVVTVDGRSVEHALGSVAARPDRLRVRGPGTAVVAGGSTTLVVTSPAAGRGLVTFESDRVHGAVVVALQRGDTTLDVPVPAGLELPNVHAVVTLTRPAPQSGPDQGPAWLIGGTSLALARPDLQVPLTLQAPAEAHPDDTWQASVLAPGASSALVALVDEGVLRITGHADPDPVGFFLAARRLATTGADTSAALLQQMQFALASKSGGDGDEGGAGLLTGSIDNRIRPYVRCAWVDLDAAGRGTASFPLSGYEGRVRAMVVAAGTHGMGSASAGTVVRAPLSLQVATPRMVAPGDTFVLPVTLRSRLPAGRVVIELRAEGALACSGELRRELELAEGAEVDLAVPVQALEPAPGTSSARLVVRARHGEQVREVAAEFTVRARTLWRQELVGMDFAVGGELQVGDGWTEVEAVVRRDARADLQLAPVLQRLLDYPFGCAEQTTSVAKALLAARTLLPRWFGERDPRVLSANVRLEQAVHRLLGMQTDRGGFGWWPGSDRDDPFVTAHVVDFLVQARGNGLAVGETELDAALQRCQLWLRDSDDTNLRCRLVEVLVRAGRPVQPWLDWLGAQALGTDARLRLCYVLGRLGQRQRAEALLVDDGESVVRSSTGGDFVSPLRTQALRFAAARALAPHAERTVAMAAALQRAILAEDQATTQENVACFTVLAEHYAEQPAAEDVRGRLLLDGRELALGLEPLVVALHSGSKLLAEAGGRGCVLVELRGQHHTTDGPRAARLQLRRELVDVETGAVVTEARRGRLYELRIDVDVDEPVRQFALVDLLPGGFEAEAVPPGARASEDDDEDRDARAHRELWHTPQAERRDDRVLFFFDRVEGRGQVRHRVRAVLPGRYEWPALRAFGMYDPEVAFVGSPADPLVIAP
ncbi:MAG: MG2 domain-containing protein [Planctomycetota bacterium]